MNPALLVIAGPNGAGKTRLTRRLRADHWSEGVEHLNPDDIARDRFGDWNSPEAVLHAARWAEARREELLVSRAGIAFETVFSAPDKVEFIHRARQAGYFVRVFFIGTGDPRINASRVADRVIRAPLAWPSSSPWQARNSVDKRQVEAALAEADGRITKARGDAIAEAEAHASKAELLLALARVAEGASELGRAAELAHGVGDVGARAQYLYGQALLLGRLPNQENTAERVLRVAAAAAHVAGNRPLEVKALHRLAEVFVARGDWDEALAQIDVVTQMAVNADNTRLIIEILRVRAAFLQGRGRPDAALADLDRVVELAAGEGDPALSLQVRLERRVLQDYTIPDTPKASFAGLLEEAEQLGHPGVVGDLRLQRAAERVRAGDYANGLVEANAAREAARIASDPFRYRMACLLVAEVLERTGDFPGVFEVLPTCKKTLEVHLGAAMSEPMKAVQDSLGRR